MRLSRCCAAISVVTLVMAGTGCQIIPDRGLSCPATDLIRTGFNTEPRVRLGCYPTDTLGTLFLGRNLGSHGYYYTPFEKDGMVYTCRGGHIDITHLRIAADWAAYLVTEAYERLMKDDPHFSFGLAVDRSTNHVHISYPENWTQLPPEKRAAVAKEVALAVGPYLSYTMTTWHEILTWFGFKCVGVATEFPSAFSWEDSYSNLLGTIIAGRALHDTEHSYDEAITIALDEEMERLGIQSAHAAKRASARVKGKWFTGSVLFFVDVKKRNFDIGLSDGMVTPTMLNTISRCADAEPLSYPVPNLDVLEKYGFSLQMEIEPHEWERNAILAVAYPDPEQRQKRIDPTVHFTRIMDHVKQEAARKYGEAVFAHPDIAAQQMTANSQ
ncbi:MAG: DUF4056 domain-containing protein [Phycisphaerales bacterium]|nr:MAG: DUF4056 domain-containing protein [Phycisphaerales bacterium]